MTGARIRIFVALLPDKRTLVRMRRLQRLLGQSPRWRLVPPERLHLTLAFLGSQPAEVVDAVAAAIRDLRFEVSAGVMADWLLLPRPARPRVIATAIEPAAPLQALAQQVGKRLAAAGVSEPVGEFLPHVTLARLRPGRKPGKLPQPVPQEVCWRAIGLIASEPAAGGVRYRPLVTTSSRQSSGQT